MAEQRYRVVDRLEAGGMAEVFRGEAVSVQGFRKQVAIKRVLPHLAQNRAFMAMFLDEARLGARLSHANIVSVFDIGAADNTYFLVMEYVDGCNLKAVMESLRRQGRRFGVKEALFIAIEVCRALAYAHELTDEHGRPLGIVHRDISPPNILLSKRGEVKVTDFGLAKASTQLEKTDPGVVKGKFSYLSPEAASGGPVDHRTDLFALGILLWEMLAGRRLFLGETDYQTVKLVQNAHVPSLSRLNPDVDAELEGLVGTALRRDPAQRYQSATDMGDALASYLFSHKLKVTSFDIAALVRETLEHAGPRPVQPQSIIDRLIQEELLRFTSLEDMSDPLRPGRVSSPDEPEGARPLDASDFENPASWFANDAEVANAVAAHGGSRSEPGWRESGLDVEAGLAVELEGDATGRRSLADARTAPKAAAGKPSLPAGALALLEEERPHRPSRSSRAWIYVLVGLVLLGAAGAAAWLGGFVPR
ncbi:MAG: serine/threonine protein kinase [Myxococcota bacterium]|nr:serine/threonine protein kinase [Myxococcota bacterium]MDW8361826.1 serine/threonine-protein kinase [Myxococcales bacterium]